MTENKHPESILIGGATVRNLIHGFSIGAPQGVRGFGYPPPPQLHGARLRGVRIVLRSGRSVVICIGMLEVGRTLV